MQQRKTDAAEGGASAPSKASKHPAKKISIPKPKPKVTLSAQDIIHLNNLQAGYLSMDKVGCTGEQMVMIVNAISWAQEKIQEFKKCQA